MLTVSTNVQFHLKHLFARIKAVLFTGRIAILLKDGDHFVTAPELCDGLVGDSVFHNIPISGLAAEVLGLEESPNIHGLLRQEISRETANELEKIYLNGVHGALCCQLRLPPQDQFSKTYPQVPVGVIYTFGREYDHQFNDDDIRLLDILANDAVEIFWGCDDEQIRDLLLANCLANK